MTVKNYTVKIDEFAGKIFVDFRQYDTDTKQLKGGFSVSIEPTAEADGTIILTGKKCLCEYIPTPRESAPPEIPITEIQYTKLFRDVLFSVDTGKGKPYGAELLAETCITCFLFAQFWANIMRDTEKVSNEIKRLSIFCV